MNKGHITDNRYNFDKVFMKGKQVGYFSNLDQTKKSALRYHFDVQTRKSIMEENGNETLRPLPEYLTLQSLAK